MAPRTATVSRSSWSRRLRHWLGLGTPRRRPATRRLALNGLEEGARIVGACPSCGQAEVRFFFWRWGWGDSRGRDRGGFWIWCPACGRYEHSKPADRTAPVMPCCLTPGAASVHTKAQTKLLRFASGEGFSEAPSHAAGMAFYGLPHPRPASVRHRKGKTLLRGKLREHLWDFGSSYRINILVP